MKSKYIDASPSSRRSRNRTSSQISNRKAIPVHVVNNPASQNSNFQPQNLGLIMRGSNVVGKVILMYSHINNSVDKVAYYIDGREVHGYRGSFKTNDQAREIIEDDLSRFARPQSQSLLNNSSNQNQNQNDSDADDQNISRQSVTDPDFNIDEFERQQRIKVYQSRLEALGYLDFL